jgi:hypothetical protein
MQTILEFDTLDVAHCELNRLLDCQDFYPGHRFDDDILELKEAIAEHLASLDDR